MIRLVLLLFVTAFVASCTADESARPTDDGDMPANEVMRDSEETIVPEDPRPVGTDLTPDNITTQAEDDAETGGRRLVDRSLFVFYLVENATESIDSLMDGLTEVRRRMADEDITPNETDMDVIVAGVRIEKPEFNLCEQFQSSRDTLDTEHPDYTRLERICGMLSENGTDDETTDDAAGETGGE